MYDDPRCVNLIRIPTSDILKRFCDSIQQVELREYEKNEVINQVLDLYFQINQVDITTGQQFEFPNMRNFRQREPFLQGVLVQALQTLYMELSSLLTMLGFKRQGYWICEFVVQYDIVLRLLSERCDDEL